MNVGLIIVSFLTSLTSLAYYFISSNQLAVISGKETIAQAFGLAVFLGGIALGSAWIEGRSVLINSWRRKISYLTKVELLVTLSGSTILSLSSGFILIYLLFFNINIFAPYEIPSHVIFSVHFFFYFILGFFSGLQLPLLLKWKVNYENPILIINYAGALVSGVMINYFIAEGIEAYLQNFFVLMMNMVTILTLVFMRRSLKGLFFAIPILGLMVLNLELGPEVKKRELAAYYFGIKLNSLKQWKDFQKIFKQYGNIQRFYSPYQKIDLVSEDPNEKTFFHGNQTLYLNRRPQFDLYTYKTYHESMLIGALNLSKKRLEDILILGGGDAILLNQALKQKSINKITLVELDPVILEMARTHPILARLNDHVLEKKDQRLTLIVDDAISYLRKSHQQYDAIFIDFPYPYSDELKKLYSFEFYHMIKNHLKPQGFFILDFPVIGDRKKSKAPLIDCLMNTLEKAGLNNVTAFGPYSPFVFVSLTSEKKSFDFNSLPSDLSLSTSLNLLKLDYLLGKRRNKECLFSMFSRKSFW